MIQKPGGMNPVIFGISDLARANWTTGISMDAEAGVVNEK
jgi:hypothetical protein